MTITFSAFFEFFYKTFVALFVILDPFAIVPVFISYMSGATLQQRVQTARRATLIAGVVLGIFALSGDSFLDFMGISDAAFKIAGGILLMYSGVMMVLAHSSGIRGTTQEEAQEAAHLADISVFPLAIPLIAGPGGITTVVMTMRDVEGQWILEGTVILIIVLVLLLTYLCLLASQWLYRLLGLTGTNVLTRIFGIIITAISVEYILQGLAVTFPGWVK